MSNYQQYSGNPYGQAEAGYGSNLYGGQAGGYGASNPYEQQEQQTGAPPLTSTYSQASQYSAPPTHQGGAPLSKDDYLARIEGAKVRINHLTANIQEIASIHQRMLSSPDSRASSQLEGIVTATSTLNTGIKDEIKFLERDAAREPNNTFKAGQVGHLKRSFSKQLEEFQQEEASYSKRYREAIARQYRIVNPEASEAEIQEAANADWNDEGIFQTALKSNRTGQAASVLGAVRARHNDIQRIEKTMVELATLFAQLNEQVVYQEAQVTQAENQTTQVVEDSTQANKQLDQGIQSIRRARKLKLWILGVVVLIIAIVALALGIYFGVVKK
ncbi:t-SNARE [Amniculicola lignicola CBS 123094]|uniref:t-SNARE n=1 Tax=Amniculicola lignicola CBS 123094 TaxID=1392246 RepID=A0A6A5WGB4_9PLEO|nr:t-SNARE [Amniculicola lignicola CBS 123094]